ncbi:MAG: aldo/keto reductase [Austwickia sp.]|jgi:1-deoxyxylulose-5-phosphate synthase|nr:MAG: aldo/keto reductase [Austwickia sp.]
MAQVAMAWVRRQVAVTSPIVGATKLGHLTDAVAACAVQLTDEEVRRLEAAYTPRRPEGF